jgi:hypothetical protein
MKKEEVFINILTRTSNRPFGFYNCRQSIVKQKFKNIKHYVSYESETDLMYVNDDSIIKVKVEKKKRAHLINPEGHIHAPYNLYCNALLEQVGEGWIMFLDDDDHLMHNKVIKEIAIEVKRADTDTLLIWQMRYPNGKLLPIKEHFVKKQLVYKGVGSPCFLFHSKHKKYVQWDEWQGSDFRVLKMLFEKIPNKKWLKKVYVQINNYGDFGKRSDIVKYDVTRKLMFNKTLFWYFIPKYHTSIIYIFQLKTYMQYWKRGINKLKRILKRY